MASTQAWTQRDIENDVELHRHGQEALALIYTSQPKNTLKSYSLLQKEFEVILDSYLYYMNKGWPDTGLM
jgi:hypothetical protein